MTKAEVVEAIAAIDVTNKVNGYSRITADQATEIAALFNGDSSLFWELDNHPPPSDSGAEWHWKLRQARNNYLVFWTRLQEDAVKKEPSVSDLIRAGTVCATCADEGERSCDCYERLTGLDGHR